MPLTAERLREVLEYSPDTGIFFWRIPRYKVRVGVKAGNIKLGLIGDGGGYRIIGVDNRSYRAHRLAWLYMTGEWPSADIDHRDGNRDNNCWNNLREATRGQNLANKRFEENRNKSGFKGVSWDAKKGKWAAFIKKDRKSRFLGYYPTKEMAHGAYCHAAVEVFGDFARFA